MSLTYAPRLTKPVAINFNDRDRVRLKMNDLGWKLHRRWHDDLFAVTCPDSAERERRFPYRKPEVGEDGCVEFHLWEVAHIFGKYLYNGCEPPFELSGVLLPCL
jgi:hypothetical protein